MELLMDSGISLSSASQSIRAQLADLDVCSQIDVELGAAVLFVERIVHDTAGRPVEYVRSWYRGDRYEYAVTLDLARTTGREPLPQARVTAPCRAALRRRRAPRRAAARGHARRPCSSSAIASAGSSLALCGVELSRPNVACTAARRLAWAARGDSSLSTVTHSSTYSRCRRRICRRAGSGTLASSRLCTVIRSGWLSAKLTCQRSSASSAAGGVGGGGRAAAALGEQPLADVEQHLRQDGFLAGEVPVDARGRTSRRPTRCRRWRRRGSRAARTGRPPRSGSPRAASCRAAPRPRPGAQATASDWAPVLEPPARMLPY